MTEELHQGAREYCKLAKAGDERAMADLFERLANKYGYNSTSREIEFCISSLKETFPQGTLSTVRSRTR